ncbi:hypothetical protein SDJN02_08515, partial [Cucurbita argyrosperma subsp. argyrosperma]
MLSKNGKRRRGQKKFLCLIFGGIKWAGPVWWAFRDQSSVPFLRSLPLPSYSAAADAVLISFLSLISLSAAAAAAVGLQLRIAGCTHRHFSVETNLTCDSSIVFQLISFNTVAKFEVLACVVSYETEHSLKNSSVFQ